ncbi:VOC family protein [Planotetraspora kaengkrachanensis]|uniref:VOC domain-containing protein n=1 Tax=Planotetraspora kaengkrachanensis TaxID=575193 RepID=A0A8J3LRM7_9ACTN|nr:VOC family protein [Planotetraspora kaengkrachanensis]GIG77933.1 hypothetical protein Pka01_10600 [Planotetraspora kaengkrachanensis]
MFTQIFPILTTSDMTKALWFYAAGCDAAVAELRDAGVPVLREPAGQEWGERTAMVEDPDGSRVLGAAKGVG